MVQKLKREEVKEIEAQPGWILIYGRRKVGKTFLVKNFISYDAYFYIRRDLSIRAEKIAAVSAPELAKVVTSLLQAGKTVVLDEFQRLPNSVLEDIAGAHPAGRLLLLGSSFRVVKKVFAERSPLLGLLAQYNLSLIRPVDIILGLKHFDAEARVELAPYLRDPWTIPLAKRPGLHSIYSMLAVSKATIPALVGEIFLEEERELTKVYEAILRLIGAGRWELGQITAGLFERGIISKEERALVHPYVKILIKMGLVEAIKIFEKKKVYLRIKSAPISSLFYLNDRYNFEEQEVSFVEVEPTLRKLVNLEVQHFIGDLFAQLEEGRKYYFFTPEAELDFIICRRKKPRLVGEVKFGDYSRKDIERFLHAARVFDCKKVFIVKRKRAIKGLAKEVLLLDAKDLFKLAKKWRLKRYKL